MKPFEIKGYISGKVLFSLETTSPKLTLEAAVKRGAYLTGADDEKIEILRYLSIGPIGSRGGYLDVFFTKKGIHCRAGCFHGTLEELETKAQQEHGDNEHGVTYAAAIAFIRTIDGIKPKKKKAAA